MNFIIKIRKFLRLIVKILDWLYVCFAIEIEIIGFFKGSTRKISELHQGRVEKPYKLSEGRAWVAIDVHRWKSEK